MTQRLTATALVLAMAAVPAGADEPATGHSGWGPRVGLRIDPDQVTGGVHINAGRLFDRVRYQPSVELGVGDDVTVISINALEGTYRFAENWEAWSPYLGGGLGIVVVNHDGGRDRGDDSHTDVGLSAVGGIEKGLRSGSSFFVESRLGLIDQPDLELTVGWTFH